MVRECLEALENNSVFLATQIGEPQLGRRGLYHLIMGKTVEDEVMLRTNILAYADGHHDLDDMSELFNVSMDLLERMVVELREHDLLRESLQSNHVYPGHSF